MNLAGVILAEVVVFSVVVQSHAPPASLVASSWLIARDSAGREWCFSILTIGRPPYSSYLRRAYLPWSWAQSELPSAKVLFLKICDLAAAWVACLSFSL